MSILTFIPLRGRNLLSLPSLPAWLTSLRGNFILFVVLFCLFQSAGIVLLTAHVSHTKTSLNQASTLRDRLALLDRARIELLTASDNSHRAGIYLMQDQQSGSVDSWKSLAQTAKTSLAQAQKRFTDYHAAPESNLQQSFVLLTQGLDEQLKGLAANNIDAFFMVPMQAAHAGVYGRSFLVVAKEIGLLSNKSGHSTRQIDGLIQHTRQHVHQGFNKVKSLETLFMQISQAVSAIVTQLNELQHNAQAQSHRVTHIAAEVIALDQQLQANEDLSSQQGRAADALQLQASRLAQSVQQFRINAA